jgi:hypothetical protein
MDHQSAMIETVENILNEQDSLLGEAKKKVKSSSQLLDDLGPGKGAGREDLDQPSKTGREAIDKQVEEYEDMIRHDLQQLSSPGKKPSLRKKTARARWVRI